MQAILHLLMLPLVAALATGPADSSERKGRHMIFQFDSGAPYHPEGFGAWSVRLEGSRFSIQHEVRDRLTRFDPVKLRDPENKELWDLIQQAHFDKRSAAQPPALPDQAEFTFTLTRGGRRHTLKTRLDWNNRNDPFVRLTLRIESLIEKYTGVKPVLR